MVSKCVLGAAPLSVEAGQKRYVLWNLEESKRNPTFPQDRAEDCGELPSRTFPTHGERFCWMTADAATHGELNYGTGRQGERW